MESGRWFEYSFDEQMGNIGSDIHRFSSAMKRGDKKMASNNYKFALELIYLTLIDSRRKNRISDIKRVRHDLKVVYKDYKNNKQLLDKLNKYLYEFAYRC